MSVHYYKGELGEFNYENTLWQVTETNGVPHLHWKSWSTQACDIPKGLLTYRYLFRGCHLSKSNLIPDIIKSELPEVASFDMSYMFMDCEFDADYDLPQIFDGPVTTMEGMFKHCVFPDNFRFPNHFGGPNVVNMSHMFENCYFPPRFHFGPNFCVTNVKDMNHMFADCRFSENFKLPKSFNTAEVTDMSYMFANAKFSKGCGLGEGFSTASARDLSYMFTNCELQPGFAIGAELTFSNAMRVDGMFENALLPKSLQLPEYGRFIQIPCYASAFKGCKRYEDVNDNIESCFDREVVLE